MDNFCEYTFNEFNLSGTEKGMIISIAEYVDEKHTCCGELTKEGIDILEAIVDNVGMERQEIIDNWFFDFEY